MEADDDRLGALLVVRRVPKRLIVTQVVTAFFFIGLTSLVSAVIAGFAGFLISMPFGLMGFVLLGAPALRLRKLAVALHDRGVVVCRGNARMAVAFDDVDEVWLDLNPITTPLGEIALIRHVRVVNQDRSQHKIPIQVEVGHEIARAILLHCSHPLGADAQRALRDGETLTFGRVRLDAQGLRVGRRHAAWTELSLVRCQPSRISFFRRQKVIPWRTVRLDRVPHPTVFVKLVRERALRFEVDNRMSEYLS